MAFASLWILLKSVFLFQAGRAWLRFKRLFTEYHDCRVGAIYHKDFMMHHIRQSIQDEEQQGRVELIAQFLERQEKEEEEMKRRLRDGIDEDDALQEPTLQDNERLHSSEDEQDVRDVKGWPFFLHEEPTSNDDAYAEVIDVVS